ncbi:transcription termination factor Rho [Streptomyces sp. SID8379]|uniref:transcription termination factor Rho n=1 Tax=unclassified Streptomyces TaxID=2593676 RepID=UPI000366EC78|nr:MULTISPECIES: transcription termination factor Rho [unclassified Streptomyces]MYW64392.1 transcription termination factor Rho [Streptomyces sp. SID8379]
MTTTLEAPAPATPTAAPAAKPPVHAAGVLDTTGNGAGFLRASDLMPTSHDVQVPAHLIRQFGLRKGDFVTGLCGKPRTLAHVETVEGIAADAPANKARTRPRFAELTPLHPTRRLRLDGPEGGIAGRVVDLFAPVGKGQRGLIVAPPKTGKTVLLQQLAAAIAAHHPETHLMVVLLDERPEEVTDMRRSVRGEVFASTFDRPAKEHIALAELAVERAKRLTERGVDVVILLDSLTRLCRAHNNAAASGGRTLSGGVDAAALLGPKRLFGAARNTEEAGSLTILATALVDTGSRADDYYFEELKSTGNMELRLDRTLADARVFPAVDITPSGTRREELLLPAGELAVVRGLRRALQGREGRSGYEALLEKLRKTPDNAAFLRQVHGTVPGS